MWADDAASPGLHADFKLSASGETLYLVTPQKSFADQVTFADAEEDLALDVTAIIQEKMGAAEWPHLD